MIIGDFIKRKGKSIESMKKIKDKIKYIKS